MNTTIERPARAKGTKAATEAARMMFLYGEGDGVRILDVQELAKRSGVHHMTIRTRMPEWQKELEEKLKSTSKLGSVGELSVAPEIYEKNSKDVSFIRARMDEIMTEVEDLGPITLKLEDLVGQFTGEGKEFDKALVLLDKYLRFCMNRKSLMKLFTELKTSWNHEVGLDAIKAIQISHAKALKPTEKPEDPSPEAGNVSVFRR